MRVLSTRWFSGRSCVGIVRVETDFDGIEYRIATVPGFDSDSDRQYIAEWGSRFPDDAGDVLFGVNKKG